jgi:hypothetical protein
VNIRGAVFEHVVRFATHFLLAFFNGVPEDDGEIYQACQSILQTFIGYLIHTKQFERVALYTSKLTSQAQIDSYASFLKGISERALRQQMLELAAQYGLDIQEITSKVVMLLSKSPIPSSEDLEESIVKSRLEWLTFEDSDRGRALIEACKLMRELVARGNLETAKTILKDVIPQDSVGKIQLLQLDQDLQVRLFIFIFQFLLIFPKNQENRKQKIEFV